MKIGFCLNINEENPSSGKHKFLIRLAKEMKRRNIVISNKNPDIFIALIGKVNNNAKLNVIRLDGLIFNTRWDYKNKNRKILKSIKKSNALIYQGKFCRDAYHNFLRVSGKIETIISNGASIFEFSKRNPKNFFLANCKWRPHKRLKDIIKSFLLALELGIDSDLIITGNPDYKIKHNRIKYLGWQRPRQLKRLLSEAIASFHLSWLDWCPNSMIEAIVARCPVIFSISGGHEEIAKNSGIGIKDIQWNYKLCDLYSPPKINRKEVVDAMFYLKKSKNILIPIRDDLNIETVCSQYIDYFNKLLKNKK